MVFRYYIITELLVGDGSEYFGAAYAVDLLQNIGVPLYRSLPFTGAQPDP